MDELFTTQDDESLRSLLRTVLMSVPDAMIIINERGVMVAFSTAAEELFGYSANEMMGQNVSLLMSETDRPHHDRYIRNYLETGEHQIIGIGRVVTARLANGEERQVHLTIGEAKLDGQHLFTGYIRDVTEQQKTEHRLSTLQAELSSFSRLSAVGTMASAMAHELNQPLTAVSNYLEAARDLLATPDEETLSIVKEALNAASAQSVRAGQIIRRLRDYVSRGELEMRPVHLGKIVEESIALSKIGLEGPLPRIFDRVEPNLPPVLADRLQIKQVLLNLVKNAIEALAGTESPQIWIRVFTAEPTRITVEVCDNGPGLSQESAETVFTPFNSTKPDGMGLGLSICQTIIEAHNEALILNTSHEDGACFSFTLNAADLGKSHD